MAHKQMTPDEVRKRLENNENLSIIDVREDDEVAEGIIPGAAHIPLGELHLRLNEINQGEEHIMVCRSGGRSGKATDFLLSKGFKVKNMPGGMLEWDGKVER
ncbi:rhodanese-like domain-containing protein [Piscibacillus halophilus]|uniref:Rhodanese-related sulfurtransferase n=1 Tax=Piscibacillus halophilus TaxID=571933 RepID=A0A1H9HFN9_9BACI|nr:rhodanese-like domain-containing protein [Piscibacillus halophilus]SEQ61203.1 Rhodanese-related sulfurtransferase [Piscibacillus halophilus]